MPDTPTKTYDLLLRRRSTLIIAAVGAAVLGGGLTLVLWPWIKPLLSAQSTFSILLMVAGIGILLSAFAICTLAERKIAGFVQDRRGPNRVGFWGLFQPVADGLKFLLKEDFIPARADRPVFLLAPCIALVVSLLGFAIIPWAGEIHWPWMPAGHTVSTQVASINVGVLYLLATGSLSVYAVVLAGWASNNKYAHFGGLRATAQMLSYEVPLGLGLLCVLLACGTLRLEEIVQQQAASGVWNVFLHPLAFLLVLISTFAETNRTPFDLAEAEQELVGGFHTEYSSMKFAMFFIGEYTHMITASALMVALFFGGWAPLPFGGFLADSTAWGWALVKFGIYAGKVSLFIGFFMLIRWTIPRFRFDQLMRLAWKGLVPIGMAMVVGSGVLVALERERNVFWSLVVNVALLSAALGVARLSKQEITGRQANMPEIEVGPV
ncbi:MAG: NADH-quinone oxidoreductase subunit NuoH [Planctomycetes bacterium]|nr:NADH-quinone oxidoreductase subunit NuoH [Planctomycetota bacterium]